MDPVSGVLALVIKYGATHLAKAVGGTGADADLLTGLITAAVAREQVIDRRLDDIERALDALLDQAFEIHLRAGTEYLFSALVDGRTRASDLENARSHLLQAEAAARTSFQSMRALRYLVVCLRRQGRAGLAARALARLEIDATDALFDAESARHDHQSFREFAKRRGVSLGFFSTSAAITEARRAYEGLYREKEDICTTHLIESSTAAPSFGLGDRSIPVVRADGGARVLVPASSTGRVGPLTFRLIPRQDGHGQPRFGVTLGVALRHEVWIEGHLEADTARLEPGEESIVRSNFSWRVGDDASGVGRVGFRHRLPDGALNLFGGLSVVSTG